MKTEETAVPTHVRLTLAHAAVQTLANAHGVDLLHVKGLALDPSLVWEGRSSTDVDVLVRPEHVRRFLSLLGEHGWRISTSFEAGSAFEHSTTLWHDQWEHLDLHRTFPGIDRDPSRAFELLWKQRQQYPIASVPCEVPSLHAQALLLLLHAARAAGAGRARQDIRHVWEAATPELRRDVEQLVDELKATVAFSVILGELDRHRDAPEYGLWKVWSEGGTRFDEWRARVRAAPTLRNKVKMAARSILVNVEHLEHVRGRPVTRAEIVAEFFARPARGFREELRRRSGESR